MTLEIVLLTFLAHIAYRQTLRLRICLKKRNEKPSLYYLFDISIHPLISLCTSSGAIFSIELTPLLGCECYWNQEVYSQGVQLDSMLSLYLEAFFYMSNDYHDHHQSFFSLIWGPLNSFTLMFQTSHHQSFFSSNLGPPSLSLSLGLCVCERAHMLALQVIILQSHNPTLLMFCSLNKQPFNSFCKL